MTAAIIFSVIIALLVVVVLVTVSLYSNLRRAIKKFYQDILEKKETDSNVRLTLSEKNQPLEEVAREINDLFDELRQMDTKSQQERESFTLALHNITHDIRTPLTIASGYTQSIMKTSETADREVLQKIKQNLDTVARRLEILLDYQNLLEVKIEPKFERINLTEAVKEQLFKFYEQFESAGFEVELRLAENIMLEADEELLARILQNLLGNVLKHGRKHLKVELASEDEKTILLIENESQQAIRNLTKLTSRFYSENMSEIEASSGLGLYIVQELASLLNGQLTLDYQAPDFMTRISWIN